MLTMAPAPLARKCGEKSPVQVYGQHGVPIGQGHLLKRLLRPHGGIVDEDVEAAEALDRRRDQPFDCDRIADVGQYRQRLAAGGDDFVGDGRNGMLITPSIDDYGRTRGGERQGNGTTDVAAAARDQGDVSLEIIAGGHGAGLKVAALACKTKDMAAGVKIGPGRAPSAAAAAAEKLGRQAPPCGSCG
jgi:hypothetical protein